MKLPIFAKLFIALLLSLAVMMTAMIGTADWLFRQGFTEYLQQVEANRLGFLISNLETAYQQQGSWSFLQNDEREWHKFLAKLSGKGESTPADNRPPPPDDNNFAPEEYPPPPEHGSFVPADHPPYNFPPPPRPPDALQLGKRLRLLNANHDYVVGAHFEEKPILRELKLDKKVIGWLEIQPNEIMTDELANTFLQQQKQAKYLISGLAFVLSIFVALFLARQLLLPIRRIATGVKALATGNYHTRIKANARDELGQLSQHFNSLAQILQQNEVARRQWIADISHELRTPLSVLRGELEALQDGVRQPSPERIHSLHSEVLSLTKLVEDLYELSLSDASAMNYHKETVNITDIVLEMQQHFVARFASRGITLREISNPDIELPVFADKQRLHQLFSNLAENSCRYTDEGGFCEITLYRTKQTAMITFQDSAPNVPQAALPKLFDRLFRVEKSRSRELGGAGLGLTICKNIVEAHDGRIIAYQSPYGGLSIQVELPLQLE
ncbi:MAG: ATP-binding protein [Methylococcales bacterium]|nr:ATP-binding protein [Methylococcales bacterium]